MFRALVYVLAALAMPLRAEAPRKPDVIARQMLAPLLDPAKVDTLKGDRPINARLYRVFYWLETARLVGGKPAEVLDIAQAAAHYAGTARAKADQQCIIWSASRLQAFGCFTPAGMEKLRKGGSPVITQGPHAGQAIALDHVLPVSIVPELAARFYNLEAIPAGANLSKSNKIGQREMDLARRWQREGLLSAKGLKAVDAEK
ncbi:MAG: hypothetical protein V4819_00925 [Verrucomicrobiota bacterium]